MDWFCTGLGDDYYDSPFCVNLFGWVEGNRVGCALAFLGAYSIVFIWRGSMNWSSSLHFKIYFHQSTALTCDEYGHKCDF